MFGFSTFAQTPFAALSGAIISGQVAIDASADLAVSANITAAGAAQIDGVADDGVVEALGRTQVADDGVAGIQPGRQENDVDQQARRSGRGANLHCGF